MTDGNSVAAHPSIVRMQEQLKDQERTLERIELLIGANHKTLIRELTNYVRAEIFEPVRLVVFGLVGMTLVAVLTGVIALVLKG